MDDVKKLNTFLLIWNYRLLKKIYWA